MPSRAPEGCTLRLAGGASLSLSGALDRPPPYPPGFLVPTTEAPQSDLTLELLTEPPPPLDDFEPVFDSGSLWRVRRRGALTAFLLPHQVAIVDFAARRGRLHLLDPAAPVFGYPLDEVLFSWLLAERGAVLVHAAGVDLGGRGLLLAGESGAGKSTLARLLAQQPGALVLSDDRVVLGHADAGPFIAGTPWGGTAGLARNRSVACDFLAFLRHAPADALAPLEPPEAARRLLSLCVLPYWDAAATGRALDAGLSALGRLRAHDLGFTPGLVAVRLLTDPPVVTEGR